MATSTANALGVGLDPAGLFALAGLWPAVAMVAYNPSQLYLLSCGHTLALLAVVIAVPVSEWLRLRVPSDFPRPERKRATMAARNVVRHSEQYPPSLCLTVTLW